MLHLAIVTSLILLYGIFAKRIEKAPISGPIIFLIIGVTMPFLALDLIGQGFDIGAYKLLAELALALVLFADASKTDFLTLKSNNALPVRLLLIGLPLTIIFGYVIGIFLFPELAWIELALLAAVLAPTDAALGEQVVSNKSVPAKIRASLNVESGLNDGIVVPIVFLLLALYSAQNSEVSKAEAITLFIEEIGIGILIGTAFAYGASKLIILSMKKHWLEESWRPMLMITIAIGCFALAQSLHGSGFIAAYIGGLIFGKVVSTKKIEFQKAAEGTGKILTLLVWIIFGTVLITKFVDYFSWEIIVYSLLSLTVIRMVPVMLSLIKSGFSFKESLFTAWFGPRGLASIVFVIIVMDVNIEHEDTFVLTSACTIFFSVFAHGFSASPLANLFKNQ
jgi:NhaP-type Na+/H+ or K+/H+ antiporter